MAKRGNSRKRTNTRTNTNKGKQKRDNLTKLAQQVMYGDGKNPYYFGGTEIRNFNELQNYLNDFKDHEAVWLADWIDYLGDDKTAEKIREEPSKFKNIINTRYSELKKHVEE